MSKHGQECGHQEYLHSISAALNGHYYDAGRPMAFH